MFIKIKRTKGNKTYKGYKDFKIVDGYYIADIYRLKKNSPIKFEHVCDYCGSEYITDVRTFRETKDNPYVTKMACSDCKGDRLKEVCLVKYGVDNVMKVDEHKNTLEETMLANYGVKNGFQSEDVKKKIRKTNIKKYGFPSAMQNKKISSKSKRNSVFAQYKSGTINTSKQQLHIHSLVGGELNYPIDTLSLDIAFPEDMIYLEYDGGGHNLSVKIGRETEKEFFAREIKRYTFLKSKGWKQIVINSPLDFLPSDDILIQQVKNAIKVLKNTDKNHYIINIPTSIDDMTFGELRKI